MKFKAKSHLYRPTSGRRSVQKRLAQEAATGAHKVESKSQRTKNCGFLIPRAAPTSAP
jgi:hypothetical protein